MSDRIVLHFKHTRVYLNTEINAVGATTSQTLRTIPTPAGDIAYVRKFGEAYTVTNVVDATISTPRSDGGGANIWKWELRGADTDTLYGYVTDENGASAFTAGSSVSTAEQLICKLVWIQGTTAAIVANDIVNVVTADNSDGNASSYADDSDGTLDSPNSAYDTQSQLMPIASSGGGFTSNGLKIRSGKIWSVTGIQSAGSNYIWEGSGGGASNDVIFQAPGNWDDFSGSGDNGLQRFFLPKNANGDQLGGYLDYYYHDTYWTTAFNGNSTAVVFSKNGSVYKGSISSDNLVVRYDGVQGYAGGGSSSSLNIEVSPEVLTGAGSIELYASATGSTYYDNLLRYGGVRHSSALNDSDKPFFDPVTAEAACADANDDGVCVLDSATYDYDITLDLSQFSLYCSLGQSAKITRGIGARVTREVTTQYNNATAIYFNENGDNGYGGT